MNIEEFDWYRDLNEKWPVVFFKNLFELSNDISTESNPTILSLTQNGVKVRDISNNEGQISASYENSAIAKVGDFVLNPMDLRSGSVSISEFEGVVSNAYFVFRPKKQQDFPCHPRFYEILFKWHYTTDIFYAHGRGVGRPEAGGGGRWTLSKEILLNFPLINPPLAIQENIASLIDSRTTEINKTIDLLDAKIDTLKTYKSIFVTSILKTGGK